MPTLLYDAKEAVIYFKRSANIEFSEEFIKCADIQLSRIFEHKMGVKINKHTSFSSPIPDTVIYERGVISKFNTRIFINHHWNPISFLWKAKSGRIYEIYDTDIDCDDIEFWFEGLDVALFLKQLFPNHQLPFKLKNLSYELVVTRLSINSTVEMLFKESAIKDHESISNQIEEFTAQYNIKSEKSKVFKGVIHNWKTSLIENKLVFDLDMGSTGPHFFKKLLPFLSELTCFTRVEIC